MAIKQPRSHFSPCHRYICTPLPESTHIQYHYHTRGDWLNLDSARRNASLPLIYWEGSCRNTMGSSILFTACCWLHLAYLTFAQDNNTPTPTHTGLTPEMSAAEASASREFSALFTDPVPETHTPSGDDAGSAGPSTGSVTISREGIIAIGVVVGFVVVFGGRLRTNTPASLHLTILSCFVCPVLPGQEEVLGGPRQYPKVREARRNCFDSTPIRIPKKCAKPQEKLERHVED